MKKRALTLLEIMVVIFLITLITGAIGYNMKGALSKGKDFKTEQAKERLHDLLLMCLYGGNTANEIKDKPLECLKKLGLAKDPEKLLKDDSGRQYTITPINNGTDFEIK